VNRPRPYLNAAILVLVFSGVYSINHSLFDLGVVLAAGALGYVLRVLRFPNLPLILGLVLGYMVESNYRRSLLLSQGDHMVFFQNGVSAFLMVCAILVLVLAALNEVRSFRRPASPEPKVDGIKPAASPLPSSDH